MNKKIEQKIEKWKTALLDFSKRNRLYNFSKTKRSCLEIDLEGEYVTSFLQDFIDNGIIFPVPDPEWEKEPQEDECLTEAEIAARKELVEQRKTLLVIRQKAKEALDERGVNVLYLVVGMLKWRESGSSDAGLRTPMVLVPVQLKCANLSAPFELSLSDDEDIQLNHTLKQKIENDFGVRLPEYQEECQDFEDYYNSLKAGLCDFGVVEDSVTLALLSFSKISMYADLENNKERLADHPLIQAICGDAALANDSLGEVSDDLDSIRPQDVFQVLDADASQMRAIEAAKLGKSFVLQGPPGTGKSQTITNIIAESLQAGKKVLFVSEKKAALEVVHRRLQQVNLSDFCLPLHNNGKVSNLNKTEARKQMLAQFESVRHLQKKNGIRKDNELLSQLEVKRRELNEYPLELHQECTELKRSYFSVAGELAQLDSKPDVLFPIDAPETWNQTRLEQNLLLLSSLASVMGQRCRDYKKNPWRGAKHESFSQSVVQDIEVNLSPLIEQLEKLNAKYQDFSSQYGIAFPWLLKDLEQVKGYLRHAGAISPFPSSWVDNHEKLPQYIEEVEQLQTEAAQYRTIVENLQGKFTAPFFDVSAEEYAAYMDDRLLFLQENLKAENHNHLVAQLDKVTGIAGSVISELTALFRDSETAATHLGFKLPDNRKELTIVYEICDALNRDLHIPQSWFDKGIVDKARGECEKWRAKHARVIELREKILSSFDSEILEMKDREMLRRFRQDYSSLLRFFKPAYYRDIKSLKYYYRAIPSLTYQHALKLLNELKETHDLEAEIHTAEKDLSHLYGAKYQAYTTNWDDITKALDTFSRLLSILSDFPERMKDLLHNGGLPLQEMKAFAQKWQQTRPVEKYRQLNDLFQEQLTAQSCFDTYRANKEGALAAIRDFAQFYQQLAQTCLQTVEYDEIREAIQNLARVQNILAEWSTCDAERKQRFGEYFKGLETDWEVLNRKLEQVCQLFSEMQQMKLPDAFAHSLSREDSVAAECSQFEHFIAETEKKMAAPWMWYMQQFDDSAEFYQMSLPSLLSRIKLCLDNKHQLQEWIDLCVEKRKCGKCGLAGYIRKVEEMNMLSVDVVPAYKKRFYTLWLDIVQKQNESLRNFRAEKREALIADFKELDVLQFEIAQRRVRNAVLDYSREEQATTTCHKEALVLAKELKKKSRLKPMRRLLQDMPHLALALKPCFMMSPLTVSTYLASHAYDFDVVIFDEASQVHTEDAVGAIMRGKQVIIVGDENQLPPTDFFRSSLSDESEEDNSEDYYENGSYESILVEASTAAGFANIGLRWHYRSRHEHLIAFSNKKIYGNQLITFPSVVPDAPDMGVEYIKVEDGLYTQKARTNIKEAQKVAELVLSHFEKYGNSRSLGVVTFSDAQRGAIEDCLNMKLREKRYLENFMSEEGVEPFFIKNLENVQGDERDTMIFSICYARTEADKTMRLHLGPLNNPGGKRRLNVAITRAKYNVKLVGSIEPADLSRSDNEGVALLRDYIAFAQRGMAALVSEEQAGSRQMTESPFEDSVLEFLESRGYEVDAQVGCSGYRIDLAVKHPVDKNRYVLGIECDGATYHTAETARERDRLRQTVLEDMGWRLHRIWSTDWVKSRRAQEKALIDALNEAGASSLFANAC